MKKISRRNFLMAAGVVAAAGVLAGCGGSTGSSTAGSTAGSTASSDGSTYKLLRFGESNPKVGYDVQTNTNSNATTIESLVTEPLYRWTDENEEVPVLAEDFPTISEDGLVYSFTLKDGITFTNGEPLNSNQVKFTFERMFTPSTGATSTYMYDMIKGASAMLAGEATELEGFEVVDDLHFNITLEQPFSCFVKNLGINYANIYPEKGCTEAGDAWGVSTLIGTGPYTFDSADDVMVDLHKNPNYWGDAHFDEIQVKFYDDSNTKMMAFENGDIDLCQVPAELYEQYAGSDLEAECFHDYYPLGTVFISMNLQENMSGVEGVNPLSNVKVREALSMAIDRDTLCESFLNGKGVPATGNINPYQLGYKERDPYPYDPEGAKALLAEAGYPDGLSLTAKVRSGDQSCFVVLQDYFNKIGVNMDVQVIDSAIWNSERMAGTDQLFWMGWFPLYADADNNIYSYFHSSNSAGKGCFYNNPEFDALMDQARLSTDDTERQTLYEQADEILSREDYGSIPLYWPIYTFAAKPYITNFTVGNLIYNLGYDIDYDMTKYNA